MVKDKLRGQEPRTDQQDGGAGAFQGLTDLLVPVTPYLYARIVPDVDRLLAAQGREIEFQSVKPIDRLHISMAIADEQG